MTFRTDVNATEGLEDQWCPGLQALGGTDRSRLTVHADAALGGSVALDETLRDRYPNANRWDYGVAVRPARSRRDVVWWIEVHPAGSDRNASEVGNKAEWLLNWLRDVPLGRYPRRLVWIASGRSSFTARGPQLKAAAQRGVVFVGGHLRLP